MYLLGFDIGGTKSAVITALYENEKIKLLKKKVIPTDLKISAYEMIDTLSDMAEQILEERPS